MQEANLCNKKHISGCPSGDRQYDKVIKGHKATFEGDEYVHDLDYGDGFMGANTCQILSNFPLQMCI